MTYSSTDLRRLIRLAAMAAIVFFFTSGIAGWTQTAEQSAPLPVPGTHQGRSDENVWEAQQKAQLARKENLKREQDLKKDTDKLLELATQLKQYVDKTNENTLSVDVIKKAEEIEKLARSVKDKMRRY
jgi:hypothetical protein